MRPVLYLDIDDTLLTWADGEPRPAAGCGDFLLWALDNFEVRWLTRWCPSGEMPPHLLRDFSKMAGVDKAIVRGISGWAWDYSGTKVDGIAWLEHVVLGRDFVWVEDGKGVSERDLEVLRSVGYADRYIPCNVTRDERELALVRRRLERRFGLARRRGGRLDRSA